eukprot:CAMPEP_0184746290 /NCGR_PEP_ID=MMETSP0315-20130426/8830_1 /TAXON_ID=101924 /ORGANISM="Rhodosorus marinus, Strain UTEX LB 2760" /LENGTH=172 /DNA_ID=CAMNT_0027218773 /DNA_START=734 /DNA_END=1254 /DNA_ORIENTATION=+
MEGGGCALIIESLPGDDRQQDEPTENRRLPRRPRQRHIPQCDRFEEWLLATTSGGERYSENYIHDAIWSLRVVGDAMVTGTQDNVRPEVPEFSTEATTGGIIKSVLGHRMKSEGTSEYLVYFEGETLTDARWITAHQLPQTAVTKRQIRYYRNFHRAAESARPRASSSVGGL